jgi:hypothetical protein
MINIVPPLIANENGDLTFFASIEAMEEYIEAIDVQNGKYEFFDAKGNEIIAPNIIKTTKKSTKLFELVDCRQVHFELSGKNYSEKLKNILLGFNSEYIKIDVNPFWDVEQIVNALVDSNKADCVC